MRSKKDILAFLALYAGQCFTYGSVTLSIRWVAAHEIVKVVLLDVIYGSVQFWIFRRLVKLNSETVPGWIGYTLGGATGTLLGMLL